MDITLRVGEQGDLTIVANGNETPVGSIDEALASIKALVEEATAATPASQQAQGSADMSGAAPDDQSAMDQEQGMMQGFRGKGPQRMV